MFLIIGAILSVVAVCSSYPSFGDHCVCSKTWVPVCGSDKRTYANECFLRCELREAGGHLTYRPGTCEEYDSQRSCACTLIYKPVCGSDGNTYGSLCDLECAKGDHVRLHLAHEGPCKYVDDSIEERKEQDDKSEKDQAEELP
ncbi:uncharacterized protein LOC142979211 [Anticarsia gemmatalis]|uniref:uncharacterized protein LOC142979211 n=1 Tax=Anticarsia gemmatalis TaxID=129554 RepID=UPI003F760AE3